MATANNKKYYGSEVGGSIQDVRTMAALVQGSDVIVSVCPPAAALSVAQEVLSHGFTGVFVEGNAISPSSTDVIRQQVQGKGAVFVDGGIIGMPAWQPGSTRLYLSSAPASPTGSTSFLSKFPSPAAFVCSLLDGCRLGCNVVEARELQSYFT